MESEQEKELKGALQHIIANPEDDAVRLIYADMLTDRDNPGDADRAEFIRVQINLEIMPEWHPNRRQLDTRAKELFSRNKDRWLEEVPERWRRTSCYTDWRRGFVDGIRMPLRDFLNLGSTMLHEIAESATLNTGQWMIRASKKSTT